MIEVVYEVDHSTLDINKYTKWFITVIESEGKSLGSLCFILSSDEAVLKINETYLKHNDYTDVITFNYNEGDDIKGDIFISLDRVKENAQKYNVETDSELRRVMVHGVLHLLGFDDKDEKAKKDMRLKEDEKLNMFHVEQ